MIKQIQAYRDLLNSIMNQVDIEAQIEYTQSKLLISRLGCDYRHYVFFAIASRANKQSQRFYGCDFLAFHGDAETNHINVYEYTEVSVCNTPEPRHLKRCAFKEYSKHLADDHIDKFDIEDLTYYIERYIDKTLQSIVAQSQQAT